MPAEQLSPELLKTLMTPEQFAEWERRDQTRREFWRTLQGPAQRPLGSNADQWQLFIDENKDNPAFLAVQVAEAIEEAERRATLSQQSKD